jgi:hypothetical protein
MIYRSEIADGMSASQRSLLATRKALAEMEEAPVREKERKEKMENDLR